MFTRSTEKIFNSLRYAGRMNHEIYLSLVNVIISYTSNGVYNIRHYCTPQVIPFAADTMVMRAGECAQLQVFPLADTTTMKAEECAALQGFSLADTTGKKNVLNCENSKPFHC